jgi:hypothetical protein
VGPIFDFPGRRGNLHPKDLSFFQMAYNIPYHKKMEYNTTNIDYASPIPTPKVAKSNSSNLTCVDCPIVALWAPGNSMFSSRPAWGGETTRLYTRKTVAFQEELGDSLGKMKSEN